MLLIYCGEESVLLLLLLLLLQPELDWKSS